MQRAFRGQTLAEFVKTAILDRTDEVLRQSETDAMAELLASAPDDDEPYAEAQQYADASAWTRYRTEGGIAHLELGRRPKPSGS